MINKVPHRLVLPPARPEMHHVSFVLMVSDHATNLSHTPQHPEVEYTPVAREEIRPVKFMDVQDIELRNEMACPIKVQW